MTDSRDYKKHKDYDPKTNKNLDISWKTYIDWMIKAEALEEERRLALIDMNKAYNYYAKEINQAIMNQYGEPFLAIGQELLVYEGAYVIKEALRYNETFPKSPIIVPYVGEICQIGNNVMLWPIPDNIQIVQPSFVESNQYTWSNYHVPYREAQRMRQAYLDQYSNSSK